jgi:hypothetical protein
MKKLWRHPFFIRLFHWEYWPFHVVYGPIYLYWFWISLKARSFFFFSAANPTIENGGFLMESKMRIYDLMPAQYYPATIFIKVHTPFEDVLQKIQTKQLSFPLVGKPDIGGRGRGVKKLYSREDVIQYASASNVDYLLQQFIPYPMEAGIFYYRIPGENKGHISGIVAKEFLTIEGDGTSTMHELISRNKRYILQLPELKKVLQQEIYNV